MWRQNQNNILCNLNKFHQLGCVVVKKIRVNEILNVHPKRKSHLALQLPLLSLDDFKPRATDWSSAAAELQERTVYTNVSVLSVSTGSATCNLANLTYSKCLLCLLPKWNALLTKTAPERCFSVTDSRPALSQLPCVVATFATFEFGTNATVTSVVQSRMCWEQSRWSADAWFSICDWHMKSEAA